MARALRIKGNDIHYHVILRCNNREFLLKGEEDFVRFLDLLAETRAKHLFRLYNYTILHSHAHLILSTHEGHFIDEVMHHFCLAFSRDYNKRHKRSGHLWKNRYRCKPILTDNHTLACLRYQHRNPIKAGIVSEPGLWPWCGYNFYAGGEPNNLLDCHPAYLALADKTDDRQRMFRNFVARPLTEKECALFEKRNSSHSKRFQKAVSEMVQFRLHEVSASL